MKTYLIQRNLQGAGKLTLEERKTIAETSNRVIEEIGHDKLEWQQSYITKDNLWCVYNAENEEYLKEHAKRGKFPCDDIREIYGVLTPATANIEIPAVA